MNEALERCKTDPEPEIMAAYRHLYTRSDILIRGCDSMSWITPPPH